MEKQTCSETINNAFYEALHEDWYTAYDHPIALLRAENTVRNPWIVQEIAARFSSPISLLDVGCGGGLLTNRLAQEGHNVTGIDLSENSLRVARSHDLTGQVRYIQADAYELPFESGAFDVVCAMDILEHVEQPHLLIQEASRVLKPGGLFFFHTFNRTFFSYLVVIKGVDWFVKNAPKNMHLHELFITPKEMRILCDRCALSVEHFVGLRPLMSSAFFRMLFSRVVPPDFSFCFSKSLSTGYCGVACKQMEKSYGSATLKRKAGSHVRNDPSASHESSRIHAS